MRQLVLMWLLMLYSDGPFAQGWDCSKCVVSTGPFDVVTVNQAVCPGANAVVCQLQYQKDYDSACNDGMDLLDCKTATGQFNYPTRSFAPNTCGTADRDAKGNIVRATCGPLPAGAAAGPVQPDSQATCTGTSCNPSVVLAAFREFKVSFETPSGAVEIPATGGASLRPTVLRIPAKLFETPNAFPSNKSYVTFILTVAPIGSTGFMIPNQAFRPKQAGGSVELTAARIQQGKVVMSGRIRQSSINSVSFYDLSLTGLRVATKGALITLPEAGSSATVARTDPTALWFGATVTGRSGALTTGAGIVARLVPRTPGKQESTKLLDPGFHP